MELYEKLTQARKAAGSAGRMLQPRYACIGFSTCLDSLSGDGVNHGVLCAG